MSILAHSPTNEKEYIKYCTKECGIITTTQDCTYFALSCLFCNSKFTYFDTFIAHMQTTHAINNACGTTEKDTENNNKFDGETNIADLPNDILEVKKEIIEENSDEIDNLLTELPFNGDTNLLLRVKQEPMVEIEIGEESFSNTSVQYNQQLDNVDMLMNDENEDEDSHYDDLVEESLIDVANFTKLDNNNRPHLLIKDRKMIKFLIDCYRRNTFLWDHRNKQFRDRNKRQEFLDWILMEFKRKFHITLTRDAVTRKWDNLRTVYKREITRMAQEKTNISTLWYFKELRFLNKLYDDNCQFSDTVIKETVYRRRYSAVWNDVSTHRLLQMVKENPCFYDKYHMDYRSKEKRGEALQRMVIGLHSYVDVNSIQISKRISQLRFDYSKQKLERLLCTSNKKAFVPSYSYYDAMKFMDHDIAPFKCGQCPAILHTLREREFHSIQHQPTDGMLVCDVCGSSFEDKDKFIMHKQIHWAPLKETKIFSCDMCPSAFPDTYSFGAHLKRHNAELLLPSLPDGHGASVDFTPTNYACEKCVMTFPNQSELSDHRKYMHERRYKFKCDFSNCSKEFLARQDLLEHTRLHYGDGEFQCDICSKSFRTGKNLSNHRQIHDAIKRYVCKICGSAFAQAAGLYLHKRRHNRPNSRVRDRLL